MFSRAPVKCFSLYGSNNSHSVAFENTPFPDIQDHRQKDTFSKKNFAMEVLGMRLSYVKKVFQEFQWSAFLFMAQITQILLFLGMFLLERLKITVSERQLSKRKNAMEVLGMCLPYVIRYFREKQWIAFLFMAQITQVLLFSRMGVLER